MKNKFIFMIISSLIIIPSLFSCNSNKDAKEVDICIYGGTSAGVIAAYTAKMMGKSVLLIEPRKNIGGMISGGLGYTDIGNKYVVTGLSRDFYRRLGSHYGKLEQWIFEPSVAESIFNEYIDRANVEVWYGNRLNNVKKTGNSIEEIILEDTYNLSVTKKTVRAKVFIDCTYEGDLMAKGGVSYTVGREANSIYNETYNGVQVLNGHQFNIEVDPYVIPGDSSSGLLWGINDTEIAEKGSGDKKVQAYNFRIALTDKKENMIPITKPDNYDPQKYELLVRLSEKSDWKGLNNIFAWSIMPNRKTDINNKGAFSTDMIGANWNYPEANYEERDKIWQEHVDYTKGLLYFVGHNERMPQHIREEIQKWGYPKDEYPNNGNWSHQLYVREARRMIGEKVMTQHHCQGREICDDAVGWAAYTMDSHNCDRQVLNDAVKNEGNVEIGGFGPYPISYKAITPKQTEVKNLLVPVCLSASHIAYGSIRMEPVFMVLAQSSAVAACLAIDKYDRIVQNVNVSDIQKILTENPLADNSLPEILIDNDNEKYVEKIGEWSASKWGGYGTNYFVDDLQGKDNKSIRYNVDIKKKGVYHVYTYLPKAKGISNQITVTIVTNGEAVENIIRPHDIVVEGQTSGEWVSLNEYEFSVGDDSFIEISNEGADGIVVADAVLLIPQNKITN
ncbi:MAG: FAD-dependent oxidoreductase [Dysgonomonas sp.]